MAIQDAMSRVWKVPWMAGDLHQPDRRTVQWIGWENLNRKP